MEKSKLNPRNLEDEFIINDKTIPTEMVTEILSYLHKKNLFNAGLACHGFFVIAEPILKAEEAKTQAEITKLIDPFLIKGQIKIDTQNFNQTVNTFEKAYQIAVTVKQKLHVIERAALYFGIIEKCLSTSIIATYSCDPDINMGIFYNNQFLWNTRCLENQNKILHKNYHCSQNRKEKKRIILHAEKLLEDLKNKLTDFRKEWIDKEYGENNVLKHYVKFAELLTEYDTSIQTLKIQFKEEHKQNSHTDKNNCVIG